jgi:hypothetical protein
MSAQTAPGGPESLSVMAAVLTAHQYRQGDHGCSCKEIFYDTRRTPSQIMHEHVLHVEMELLNAGVGLVAEAKAEAYEDAAENCGDLRVGAWIRFHAAGVLGEDRLKAEA